MFFSFAEETSKFRIITPPDQQLFALVARTWQMSLTATLSAFLCIPTPSLISSLICKITRKEKSPTPYHTLMQVLRGITPRNNFWTTVCQTRGAPRKLSADLDSKNRSSSFIDIAESSWEHGRPPMGRHIEQLNKDENQTRREIRKTTRAIVPRRAGARVLVFHPISPLTYLPLPTLMPVPKTTESRLSITSQKKAKGPDGERGVCYCVLPRSVSGGPANYRVSLDGRCCIFQSGHATTRLKPVIPQLHARFPPRRCP